MTSPELQATLLLCSPLLASGSKGPSPLSTGEFNELEKQLVQNGHGLADLLQPTLSREILKELTVRLDTEQLENLLGRGVLLSLAIEKWNSLGIWILTRNADIYPAQFKARLKHLAPPLLYGVGSQSALNEAGGLAIVGSRDIDGPAEEFTRQLGERCAREGVRVVSGGARGVDQLAMLAALEAGGKVTGVMADSLARSAVSSKVRDGIADGRLTLVSSYDPEAGFNVGNAMGRNKQIYALAQAGVIVNSGHKEGGTWSGAVEQLEKYRHIPLFVRTGANAPVGNTALLKLGAHPFNPEQWPETIAGMFQSSPNANARMETGDLFSSL